jgi:hypothetical protein
VTGLAGVSKGGHINSLAARISIIRHAIVARFDGRLIRKK